MTFFRKLRWMKRRPAKEAELQEELQFHLEEEAADRQATGLSNEESRRAARRDLKGKLPPTVYLRECLLCVHQPNYCGAPGSQDIGAVSRSPDSKK